MLVNHLSMETDASKALTKGHNPPPPYPSIWGHLCLYLPCLQCSPPHSNCYFPPLPYLYRYSLLDPSPTPSLQPPVLIILFPPPLSPPPSPHHPLSTILSMPPSPHPPLSTILSPPLSPPPLSPSPPKDPAFAPSLYPASTLPAPVHLAYLLQWLCLLQHCRHCYPLELGKPHFRTPASCQRMQLKLEHPYDSDVSSVFAVIP